MKTIRLCRGHLVVKQSAVLQQLNSHGKAEKNMHHLREREKINITVDYDLFGSVFL